MKKTIAIILLTMLSTRQYAQIEKGTYVPSISINASYGSNPQKDTVSSTKSSSWNSTASFGFGRFIKDNLLLTGSVSYNHSNSKQDYVYVKTPLQNYGLSSFGNTESIAAQLLKYKFITENFAIRYGVSFNINYIESINRNYNYNGESYNPTTNHYTYNLYETSSHYTNTFGAGMNLLAGIQYFVTKNLALTGNMGFFSASYSYSPYEKSKQASSQNLNFSLTPSFNTFSAGLTYYFKPKAKASN